MCHDVIQVMQELTSLMDMSTIKQRPPSLLRTVVPALELPGFDP